MSVDAGDRVPVVLMVDDDPDDILMMRRAVERSGLAMEIEAVDDGVHLLDYLHGTGLFEDREAPMPDLVLLDINMRFMNGFDAAQILKQDAAARTIPVIMLTTSEDPKDVEAAYASGAASYIVKPHDFTSLRALVERLHRYWFALVQLPEEGRSRR